MDTININNIKVYSGKKLQAVANIGRLTTKGKQNRIDCVLILKIVLDKIKTTGLTIQSDKALLKDATIEVNPVAIGDKLHLCVIHSSAQEATKEE